MPELIATQLAMSFTGRDLFNNVSLQLEQNDRIALVGPNGAGKTTLLRLLSGELEATSGTISTHDHVRVRIHHQRPPREQGTLYEYVSPDFMTSLEDSLRDLERKMVTGDESAAVRWQEARDSYEHAGGDNWHTTVDSVLRGLSFNESQFEQPLATLSGGELTRASLARSLAASPDVLLLDEPTNHLDIESIDWLIEYLNAMKACIVLVSHDRWFIEETCTSVLEIVGGKARRFKGSFVEYRAQQALEAATFHRSMEKWKGEVARLQRFVDRFSAGTRARQAQSRVKALERLKTEVPEYADLRSRNALSFKLPVPERSGDTPFDIRELELVLPTNGRRLVDATTMQIARGDRIALLGRNGTGKSTLMECLASSTISLEKRPGAWSNGEIRVGYGVSARYLSQHDAELADDKSLIGNMQLEHPGIHRTDAMNLLGLFGLGGQKAENLVANLSGGERRRLLLARALAGEANVLLLDEPTNHLDLEGREALEAALTNYQGTVLLISHDRALVEGVATRTIVLHNQRLVEVRDYDAARDILKGIVSSNSSQNKETPRKENNQDKQTLKRKVSLSTAKKSRKEKGARVRRPATIEREIEDLENRLNVVQEQMLDPDVYTDPTKCADALSEHEKLERTIGRLFEELEKSVEHHG